SQQLKKQIRIEIKNALVALQQGAARVSAAQKSRDLAQKTFEIMQEEQKLGAGSNLQTLAAQRDLTIAQSALSTAFTDYKKAEVEFDRATGATLSSLQISVDGSR
ncbi:MAG TPA: TolC family protein, partial [Dongiaceae bacterium]|nr:TolC family protein [Dongiaceae bacterium]